MSTSEPAPPPNTTKAPPPRMLSALSARFTSSGNGSMLGDLLRTSAPPWIQALAQNNVKISKAEESKRLAAATHCVLCKDQLKGAIAAEPANKKLCRKCGTVTCRLCAVHVHVMGHIRRRYICFKCVGEAAMTLPGFAEQNQLGTVNPAAAGKAMPSAGNGGGDGPTIVTLAPATSSSTTTLEAEEANSFGFLSRLWDGLWAGLGGENADASSDDEARGVSGSTATPPAVEEDTSAEDAATRAELLAASGGKFDGDLLKQLLEASRSKKTKGDVYSLPFVKACSEVIKLMAGLGKAFEFAGSDMNSKLSTMRLRTKETAKELGIDESEVTLQQMVQREIKAGTTHAGKKAAGASRTIVRLLWFLDFVGVLLVKIANEPKRDLTGILGDTYEETLAPRHVWVLRRIVRGGMSMVPDKKVFIPRLGLDGKTEAEQGEKLKSWGVTIDAVRGELWAYMKSKKLEELP